MTIEQYARLLTVCYNTFIKCERRVNDVDILLFLVFTLVKNSYFGLNITIFFFLNRDNAHCYFERVRKSK